MSRLNIFSKFGVSAILLFAYYFIYNTLIVPSNSWLSDPFINYRIISILLTIVRVILIVYFYKRVGKFKKISPKSKHYWQGTIILITFIILPWYIWKADDKLIAQEQNLQD